MYDAEHIERLLNAKCYTSLYHIAYSKAYGFRGNRLVLKDQQQLSEYIDILRICVKFKDNITAVKANIREYAKNKKTI